MDGETPAGGASAAEPKAPVPGHRRWLMLVLGWTFFGVGLLGMVLPLLPSTPFMLLALWAFSIGSERFHRWLYHHRIFGPPLQRWSRERVIPVWVKALAVTSMAASFLLAWLSGDAPWYLLAVMAAVMAAGIAYIFKFPSRPPAARAGG